MPSGDEAGAERRAKQTWKKKEQMDEPEKQDKQWTDDQLGPFMNALFFVDVLVKLDFTCALIAKK